MPGFFGDQAERLLRKVWTDPNELAQELFAMFSANVPMTTDQPIVSTQADPNEPAIKIIQSPDGGDAITFQKGVTGDPQPCCVKQGGGGDGSRGGGSGGGQKKKPPGDGTPPNEPVNPATKTGDNNTPYRNFVGSVTIKIQQGAPDVFGFNGLDTIFSAIGCFPYKPPGINAPDNAFNETFKMPDTIQNQIDAFMKRWTLDGYSVTGNTVNGPGAPCDPSA